MSDKRMKFAVLGYKTINIGDDINIKVESKSGDRGQYLHGVVIHQKSSTRSGNYKVIVSEKGELKSAPDSNVLQLELINGNYYEEKQLHYVNTTIGFLKGSNRFEIGYGKKTGSA